MPDAVEATDYGGFRGHEGVAHPYGEDGVLLTERLSGCYLSKNDFENAEKALCHFIDEHDEVPYEIYFQYAFLFMKKGSKKVEILLPFPSVIFDA